MKKIIYACITILCTVVATYGQAPSWQWARGAGGNGDDYVTCVTIDPAGSVFTAGAFSGSSLTIGSTILTNNGIENIFLAKYDASGNAIWAVSAGNEGDDGITSISIDNSGNVFMTGWFTSDTITFGSTVLINQSEGTSYKYDLFIAKYDNNGNVIWAKSAGGYFDDVSETITTDALGNVYVGGYFGSDSVTFDSYVLHNFSTAWSDLFIVKYDTNGNVIWAKSAGGNNVEAVISMAANNSGELYLTGWYSSASFSLDGITLVGTGADYDMFVCKIDSAGTAIWARTATDMYGQYSTGISLDAFDNIYVTGYYENLYLTFGSVTLTNASGNFPYRDIFLVKYDSSGSVLWANGAGGIAHEESYAVAVDALGNPYVTGRYESASLTFGSTILNNTIPGKFETFLVKYDASGNVQWAKSVGGSDDDGANSIAVSASGEGYVAGFFSSPSILFSPTLLTNANPGNIDLFLAKFDGITGIVEGKNDFNSINIFPNPVSNKLTISAGNNELLEIILYDIASRKLFQQQFTNSVSLNTEQLAKGIYLYEVSNKNGRVKKGMVVKD